MSKAFVSSSTVLLIDRLFRAAIGLGVGIVIARHYGPELFGQLSYVLLAATLFGSLATLGLDDIGPRDMVASPLENLNRNQMLATILRVRTLGGLLAYGLLVLFIYWDAGSGVAYGIALILGLYLPLQSGDAYDYRLRSERKFSLIAITRTFSAVCASTFKLISVFFGWPVYVIAAAMTGEYGLNKAFFAWINRSQFGQSGAFHLVYAKLLLRRSWKIMLSGIVLAFQVRIEYYLIEKFLDWSSVGQYAAALKIFEILDVVPIIFAMVLMPELAIQLKNSSKEQFKVFFERSYLGGLLIYGAMLPAMLFIIWAFPYAFGEKYAGAQVLLPLLLIRPLFGMLSTVRGVFVILEHRYFYPLICASIGFGFSFVFAFLLIPQWGLVGAVYANLLGLLGSTVLADLLFYRGSTLALLRSVGQFPYFLKRASTYMNFINSDHGKK